MADSAEKINDVGPTVAHVDNASPPDTLNEKDIEGKTAPSGVNTATALVHVTGKTWLVVFILSMGYGLSFWPIPLMSAIGGNVAAELGEPDSYIWYIPAWTVSITICFMICGVNTDLFGRRPFLVYGNLICVAGQITAGSAKTPTAIIAGMAVTGFGAAMCQMAAFALGELIPNKWRHIAVVIADWPTLLATFIAPVTGRYGFHEGHWRWNFYVCAILQGLSFIGLFFLYYPPAHPLNIGYKQALRELDWIGAFLFIAGALPALIGIVWSAQYPSSDAHVVAPLCVGFGILVLFALWESFSGTKHPLTPPHMFSSGRGRDYTAPVIVVGIANSFFYSSSILWPNMIVDFWSAEGADWKYATVLSLVQGLANTTGGTLLSLLGNTIRRWQWQLTVSVGVMVTFGALAGSLVTPPHKAMSIVFMFISVTGFGYALFLAIAIAQMGVHQHELGTSGGIAGVFRFAAGSIGSAVYTTVLTKKTASSVRQFVPPAAVAAGLPQAAIPKMLSLVGTANLTMQGYSPAVIAAIGGAYERSQEQGIRYVAFTSIAFGMIGFIATFFCKDVDEKMNNHTEVFLENDVHADLNEFHDEATGHSSLARRRHGSAQDDSIERP